MKNLLQNKQHLEIQVKSLNTEISEYKHDGKTKRPKKGHNRKSSRKAKDIDAENIDLKAENSFMKSQITQMESLLQKNA